MEKYIYVNIYLPFLTKAINLAITENIFPRQVGSYFVV